MAKSGEKYIQLIANIGQILKNVKNIVNLLRSLP